MSIYIFRITNPFQLKSHQCLFLCLFNDLLAGVYSSQSLSLTVFCVLKGCAMTDSEYDVKEPAHFTYIWTIENMCLSCDVDSPIFTVKEMEMTKWYLRINTCDSESVHLDIRRHYDDDGPKSIEIKFELSFLGDDGLPLTEEVEVDNFDKTNPRYGFLKFANLNEVFFRRRAKFLPKDALTVRCRMWRTGTEISKLDSCFARTRLRPRRHLFVWAIREFSTLQRGQVRKILLETVSNNHLAFELFLTEKDGEEYISINTQDSVDFDIYMHTVKICLLDFEGKVVHSAEGQVEFENFLKKDRVMGDKESLLPNDVLLLRCEAEMTTDIVWSVIENYRYLNSMSSEVIATDTGNIILCEQDETSDVNSSFAEAMESLLEEGTLSDVSLQAGSKSFPAHKCILSARSPVFKAMFSGDNNDKTSNSIEIPDLDEDTLRELLSYIYSDAVGEVEWQGAIDLYRAANKFELLELKRRCATSLKSDLSVSNVCAILSIADLHYDRELREAAQDFVMRQEAEFFTSDMWQSFKEENSKLAWEIVERVLCNMKR
ncbi:unnamed protein product [Larinioides sclopetarius]|uniref:Speckle-type POZ protein n=1 Tax=Larinioides sclopetarius TaxID=280406 RepID=A0AAV1ZY31_9ARAC